MKRNAEIAFLEALFAHSDDDTPIPTWKQVTRGVSSINQEMAAHVSRIVCGSNDEPSAIEVWNSWPGNTRRSIGLLVDKIYHEGWLDLVGPIEGWPWDGGFFFSPRNADHRKMADALDGKSGDGGVYTRSSLRYGLPAYLSGWNHPAWRRSWIENDTPFASLHVGIFKSGSAEVHLDLFNPSYTNGAPSSQVIRFPGFGAYNHELFGLHRKWEGPRNAAATRTSTNFYHLMRGRVPLSF